MSKYLLTTDGAGVGFVYHIHTPHHTSSHIIMKESREIEDNQSEVLV